MLLPDVSVSRIFGLLEVLHNRQGVEETVKLATDLDLQLDEVLPVLEASERLGLMEVKSGKMRLSKNGFALVEGGIEKRKKMLREKLLQIKPFAMIIEFLKTRKNHRTNKRAVHKLLSAELSKQYADQTIKRIIDWGRYAELIGYNSETDELYLSPP